VTAAALVLFAASALGFGIPAADRWIRQGQADLDRLLTDDTDRSTP
jgi:hypothetical protein